MSVSDFLSSFLKSGERGLRRRGKNGGVFFFLFQTLMFADRVKDIERCVMSSLLLYTIGAFVCCFLFTVPLFVLVHRKAVSFEFLS